MQKDILDKAQEACIKDLQGKKPEEQRALLHKKAEEIKTSEKFKSDPSEKNHLDLILKKLDYETYLQSTKKEGVLNFMPFFKKENPFAKAVMDVTRGNQTPSISYPNFSLNKSTVIILLSQTLFLCRYIHNSLEHEQN